ncbi:helix-turn-helix domain-containing protein [Nostoc sp.]|uniref:helix-turn-helix domain-containing protein n=1 Tax=Nostoc sp. TaxID=1180 RepID=UPI002D7805C4|nr:helix-turn-helix domain-containing protein [Nostoc sp.]
MPAPLRIILTPEEDLTLNELRHAGCVPKRTRARWQMLRLNAKGWKVAVIAKIFECHQHTVRATLRRWQERGLAGLWEEKGRGAKPKWKAADLDYLVGCLENDIRTYNSQQLAKLFKQERLVDLNSDRLRKLLKKNYRWKRTLNLPLQKTRPNQKGNKASRFGDVGISRSCL